MVKSLGCIFLICILAFTTSLVGQSFSEKPTVLFNGKFASTPRINPNEIISENRQFRCTYSHEVKSNAEFNLKNVSLYKDNSLVATIKNTSSTDVDISNTGFLVFYEHAYKEGNEVKLHFFSHEGVKLLSPSFENAVLFGFSSTGNKFGISSPEKFELFTLPSGKRVSFPGAHQFHISHDESLLALASKEQINIYQDDKFIGKILHDLTYIRKIKISPDKRVVAFIGKKKLFVYALPDCKLIFFDNLEKLNSFNDLKITNTSIWAGIHHKDREKRVSKGILKAYDLKGNAQIEEIQVERQWGPVEKLKYNYRKRDKNGVTEIPWPFKPFDKAQKIWNGYLQLASSSDGNNSGAYCHQGVDMDVPTKAKTYSVVDGYVKAVLTIGGAIYWRVAVCEEQSSDSARGWLHAHLIESSIAVNVGDEVKQGDFLGEIIKWSGLTGGHIHFSRIASKGVTWSNWRNAANPSLFLKPTGDNTPPEIINVLSNSKFAFTKNSNTSSYLDADNLSGEIDILVRVRDIWGDSPWVQPAMVIHYWMRDLKNNNIVFPKTLALWRGQGMPTYGGGLYNILQNVIYRVNSTFPAKGWFTEERLYVHVITNNNGDSIITENDDDNSFNTTKFNDGDYRFIVEVQDAAGNTTVDSQDVTFNNGINAIDVTQKKVIRSFTINGVSFDKNSGTHIINFQIPQPSHIQLEIYDLHGNKLGATSPSDFPAGKHNLIWNGKGNHSNRAASGIYLYKLKADSNLLLKKAVFCR